MASTSPRSAFRAANTTAAAFVLGLPLSAGLLGLVWWGPWRGTLAARYLSHPVEAVELILFCCALGALAAKLWRWRGERHACRRPVLPPWDGQPLPVAEAVPLLAGFSRLPARLESTWLVRRVTAVLDFLRQRGSATDLDDQMRSLADADAAEQDNSYGLIRFITWAIPILGFLGTVLGITEAISGVTPEVLEQSLSTVTDGLALAFDTTALALALTMVVMFLTFLMDRAEQGVLASVDAYAERHLAHRFQRSAAEGGAFAEVVRQQTQVLLKASEQLVQRQAEVWAQALSEVDRSRAEVEARLQHSLTAALEQALGQALRVHTEHAAAVQRQVTEQTGQMLDRLAEVAVQVAAQTEALTRVQEGEGQLVRLQEVLQQNLAALNGAGAFDEAVHSLTAAVHLLTVRTGHRPGAAA